MEQFVLDCIGGNLSRIKRYVDQQQGGRLSPTEAIRGFREVIANQDREMMTYLLEHADVDSTDPIYRHGQTALYQAIYYRDAFMMRLLLTNLANPNAIDRLRNSPLMQAIDNRYMEGCEILLEFGADVNYKNTQFKTPIYMASSSGLLEICQLLLRHGADANLYTNGGISALAIASRRGHLAIVSELIRAGANLERADINGYTPFMAAAWGGRLESVTQLIRIGVEIDQRDKSNYNPLYIAAHDGDLEMCLLLLQAGANRMLLGGSHPLKNPIQCARFHGHHDLAQTIESYVPHCDPQKYPDLPPWTRQSIRTIATLHATQRECPLATLPDEIIIIIVDHLIESILVRPRVTSSPEMDVDDDIRDIVVNDVDDNATDDIRDDANDDTNDDTNDDVDNSVDDNNATDDVTSTAWSSSTDDVTSVDDDQAVDDDQLMSHMRLIGVRIAELETLTKVIGMRIVEKPMSMETYECDPIFLG